MSHDAEGDVSVRTLAAAVIAQAALDLQRPELAIQRDAQTFLRSQYLENWLAVMDLNGQRQKLQVALVAISEEGFIGQQRRLLVEVVTPW